ncbi:hypothetical protein, partial [Martelella sp. FOR1707]
RQAHNLKAAGSNPAPATNETNKPVAAAAGFVVWTESVRIPARLPRTSILIWAMLTKQEDYRMA